MRSAALGVALAALLAPSGARGQDASQALEGAWRVVEVVPTAPGARTISAPQPGLLLFVDGYYSYMLVNGEQPRPTPPGGLASAEQLLAAWNPFAANAGTFEVSDGTMIRRPIVAKSPDAMGPGVFNEYTFRTSADTLWITSVGTETGPSRNPTTVRYVRARGRAFARSGPSCRPLTRSAGPGPPHRLAAPGFRRRAH